MSQSDFSLMMMAITPVIGMIILVVVGRLCIFLFKRYMKQVGDEETDTIADKFDRLSNRSKFNALVLGGPLGLIFMTLTILPIAATVAWFLFFGPLTEALEATLEMIFGPKNGA